MRSPFTDAALRRGVDDGLIISGVLAVVAVLTNVMFPAGPEESDSDSDYLIHSWPSTWGRRSCWS